MKTLVDRKGEVFALYRSATESVHRDIYFLSSNDHGRTFHGKLLHKWNINACPMSSMDFAEAANIVAAAWETGGQVYWTRITGREIIDPIGAPGEGKGRKHPRLAVNKKGEVLLVWTERTGCKKGGLARVSNLRRGRQAEGRNPAASRHSHVEFCRSRSCVGIAVQSYIEHKLLVGEATWARQLAHRRTDGA
jgi:hypothetical protein